MDRAFILDSYASNQVLFHCQNKRLSGLEQFARRLRSGELRNKIMRIGLHGLCGYIKLERGRTGDGDSADPPQGPPHERRAIRGGSEQAGPDASKAYPWPRSGSQTDDAGLPRDERTI